ncbi:MAG: LysR family transcriptional regulator [Alphaproteobacteria bacterium]|nr:LysR family transcriptional regulator [Alphaproteobacteria bacterium]
MQTLGRLSIFLEVAKLQSFAKAAQNLGITGPAASKQVVALEDELGVKLLHRTTRLVTLTEEGAVYYERARHAVEELKEAAEQLHDMKTTAKGLLKVNVPLSFGQAHLLPVLAGFAKQNPHVTMEVILDDKMVDVIADGYDVVIRIGVLNDSTLVSKHLGDCAVLPVASPSYIDAHGIPKTPAELKQHRLITYTHQGATMEWRYQHHNGAIGTVRGDGVFRSNNTEMMLQAALDGLGIAILPIFTISTHLKAQQLVHVLPEYETYPKRQITALMPPNRYRLAKVKLLLDWIGQSCKAMPLSL